MAQVHACGGRASLREYTERVTGVKETPCTDLPSRGERVAMAQFFPCLRSRNDSVRLRAARDLQKYVSTELRELPAESSSEILDDVNQSIFSLISSQEVHEKKGGILAIGEQPCGHVTSRDLVLQ